MALILRIALGSLILIAAILWMLAIDGGPRGALAWLTLMGGLPWLAIPLLAAAL